MKPNETSPQVLKMICWYAVLTPSYSTAEGSSSDIATLVAATAADKRLADALPLYKQLLDTFQTPGTRARVAALCCLAPALGTQ